MIINKVGKRNKKQKQKRKQMDSLEIGTPLKKKYKSTAGGGLVGSHVFIQAAKKEFQHQMIINYKYLLIST